MCHRKAARAATSKKSRPAHVDQPGRQDQRDAIPDPIAMQALYSGATCLGFLYARGRDGVEAYDADERSLGIFPTQKAAADAVVRAAGGTP